MVSSDGSIYLAQFTGILNLKEQPGVFLPNLQHIHCIQCNMPTGSERVQKTKGQQSDRK